MPCYDPRDDWDREHNNVAAELLCELLGRLSNDPNWSPSVWTPELARWWRDHQDRDAYYARKQQP